MTIEPFSPSHLDEIDLQPAQTSWLEHRDPNYARELARHVAVTARVEGVVVACAGIISLDRDVGHAWAFVARNAGRHFIRFRRAVARLFEVSGKSRILANTECDFAFGCRWLEMLGFERLELLKECGPDGRDHWLYLKVT